MTARPLALHIATESDLGELLPLVAKYHATEEIASSNEERAQALLPLLRDPKAGQIWLLRSGETTLGYLALCFCYSIEFGGYDSFIDEFFLEEEFRGVGYGTLTIEHILPELRRQGIRAISLEVATTNSRAEEFYRRCGFAPRNRYSVMTRVL